MGGKTVIGGTLIDIKPGKALMDGTEYNISQGTTVIDGTQRLITFGIRKGTQYYFTEPGDFIFDCPTTGNYQVDLHGGGGGGGSGFEERSISVIFYNDQIGNQQRCEAFTVVTGGGGGGSGYRRTLHLTAGVKYNIHIGRGGSKGTSKARQEEYGHYGDGVPYLRYQLIAYDTPAQDGENSSFGEDYIAQGGEGAHQAENPKVLIGEEGQFIAYGGTGHGELATPSKNGGTMIFCDQVYQYGDPGYVPGYRWNYGSIYTSSAGGSGGCTIGLYGTGGQGETVTGNEANGEQTDGYGGACVITYIGNS